MKPCQKISDWKSAVSASRRCNFVEPTRGRPQITTGGNKRCCEDLRVPLLVGLKAQAIHEQTDESFLCSKMPALGQRRLTIERVYELLEGRQEFGLAQLAETGALPSDFEQCRDGYVRHAGGAPGLRVATGLRRWT